MKSLRQYFKNRHDGHMSDSAFNTLYEKLVVTGSGVPMIYKRGAGVSSTTTAKTNFSWQHFLLHGAD